MYLILSIISPKQIDLGYPELAQSFIIFFDNKIPTHPLTILFYKGIYPCLNNIY